VPAIVMSAGTPEGQAQAGDAPVLWPITEPSRWCAARVARATTLRSVRSVRRSNLEFIGTEMSRLVADKLAAPYLCARQAALRFAPCPPSR
jgi:hypothetical protein